MIWKRVARSKSHFPGGFFTLNNIFMDDLFAFYYTFMDEHSNPKRHKHEENTKKTRRKDEENTKDTRNFAYFSSKQRTESSGENSPLIYEKISGLNWTTETKGSK